MRCEGAVLESFYYYYNFTVIYRFFSGKRSQSIPRLFAKWINRYFRLIIRWESSEERNGPCRRCAPGSWCRPRDPRTPEKLYRKLIRPADNVCSFGKLIQLMMKFLFFFSSPNRSIDFLFFLPLAHSENFRTRKILSSLLNRFSSR